MPKVAGLESNKSKRYSVAAILAALLISFVGLIVVVVWGHQIITAAFGPRYSDAYWPLVVLSIGMCFFSSYAIVEGFVIGRGRPNLSVQALVVALVSTAVSGFWLTSHIGALGASLSFTIGSALGTIALLLNTWRYLSKDQPVSAS
jgi:O-antigen/teichoic acid export membrane protein